MRESRIFAERTKILKVDEVAKKYFLIYEGAVTEMLYFAALNSMRSDIGINPLIELVPVIRSYSEEGWSNPKKILDRVIENIEENKEGCISYETLLNRMMEYFDEEIGLMNNKFLAGGIWRKMEYICIDILQKSLSDSVDDLEKEYNNILEILQEEPPMLNVISNISDAIFKSGIVYEEGFDKICLIVDRDKQSFVSLPENNQYAYVKDRCDEKGFGFYVTNPCFEFWILLHFDGVFALDREKLLENPKVTAKRRYKWFEKLSGK